MKYIQAIRSRLAASWQPLLAAALLCVFVSVIVGNLNRQEEDNLRNEIRTEAENLVGHINADLRNRFSVLQRMARRWDVHKSVSKKEFIDDAQAYLSHDPGFQAIEWADRDFIVRWVVPFQGNERAQNLNLAFENERRAALEKARDNRVPTGTLPVYLVQGGKGFLGFFPVYVRNRFEGVVVAVIRVNEWLNYVFSFKQYRKSDKFVISVYLDGVPVFRQAGWDGSRNAEYDTVAKTWVIDRRLTVHIRPTDAFISQSRTILPGLTAAFGFLLSILVTLILHLLVERKKAADELQDTLSQVNLLLDSTAEAIYGIDLKGNCTFANPSGLRMLGYENIEQLLGKNMHNLIHHSYPDGRSMPVEECRIYRAFREGTGMHYDKEVFWRSDGTSFPVEYWSYPQVKNGVVLGAVVTFNDITERKEAEDKLRAGEERLRNITDSARDAIVMMDSRGTISYWNPAAEDIFGYSADEALGKDLHDLLCPERYLGAYRKAFSEFRVTGRGSAVGTTLELFARRKDNEEIPVALSLSALWQDGAWHAVGLIRDVTVQKQTEAVLQEAKKVAEAANQAKSEFLATMSHEIRTPMNAIIGMAELLADTPLTPEQARYVEVFRDAGENLMNIINDILDLSKIEAGRIDIESVGFDLEQIVQKACQVMAVRASQKGLESICHILPDVPVNLIGDPVRLQQIIVNLLGNAIKFTEHGEVALEIRNELSKIKDDGVSLEFSIRDTGIGIPADKLDAIFDKFTQADSSTTRRYGGTGLGLPISRRLVELMGGTLSVESEPGKGTRFFFTLSFSVQEGLHKGTDQDRGIDIRDMKALVPLNILLVDDSEDNRLLVSSFLKKYPYTIQIAENGLDALDLFRKNRYDLVLMDMQMPVMDGYTAMKEIRAWEKENGLERTPIVALTAYALKEEMQKSIDAGCDAHLTKPISKATLLETIHAYAKI